MTIFEARDGAIWLGMHDGGANVLDPATGTVRQLPYATKPPGAISAASVTAIAEDAQGNIWIGTDDGGLDLARPDGTVVKVFRHDPADPGQPALEHRLCARGGRATAGSGSRPTAAASRSVVGHGRARRKPFDFKVDLARGGPVERHASTVS